MAACGSLWQPVAACGSLWQPMAACLFDQKTLSTRASPWRQQILKRQRQCCYHQPASTDSIIILLFTVRWLSSGLSWRRCLLTVLSTAPLPRLVSESKACQASLAANALVRADMKVQASVITQEAQEASRGRHHVDQEEERNGTRVRARMRSENSKTRARTRSNTVNNHKQLFLKKKIGSYVAHSRRPCVRISPVTLSRMKDSCLGI